MEETLNRIIAIRKAKKVSQKEIAKSLGISQAAYAKFESGKSITVDRLLKVADLLKVPIADLIYIMPTKTHNEVSEELELLSHDIDIYEKQLVELTKRIEDKDLLIEALKNEKAHIKEHLVIQMLSNFSSYVGSIDDLIAESKEENIVQKLIRFRKNTLSVFIANKNLYINTGFLSQSDFDNHSKEMEGIYKNIPES